MITPVRSIFVAALVLIAFASLPNAARADLLYCPDDTAEVYVGKFIAEGRSQVDVAISGTKSTYVVDVSISTDTGQLLQSKTFDLSRISDYDDEDFQDVAGMVSFKNLPTTGGFVIGVGSETDSSYDSGCDGLTIDVPRKPGRVDFKWTRTSYGYLLAPNSFALPQIGSGDYNYGKAILGTCQTLPIGVSGTVDVSGAGVSGTGSRQVRVSDVCELVPGQVRLKRTQTAGATIGSGRSLTVNPDYKVDGRQTYSMSLKVQGKTIRLARTTTYRASYRVWEGTDEYFNYCVKNLFDVDIIMQDGRRYCVKPAARTF
jgi:hypothetical protein